MPTETLLCPYCGAPSPEAAQTCESCGKTLPPLPHLQPFPDLSPSQNTESPNTYSVISWVFAGIAVVFAGCLVLGEVNVEGMVFVLFFAVVSCFFWYKAAHP